MISPEGSLHTAAIVLAAGASRRLGQPKQLIQLKGEMLLDRAVRIATQAGCAPVVVVLGAEAALVQSRCTLHGAQVILNHRWTDGMSSSIHAGMRCLSSQEAVTGVILTVCDQPAVTPQHLRALAASGELTASEYADRRGVPSYIPAALFLRLAELTGDAGARDLLREARAIPLPHGELDIDTPGELKAALRLLAS